MGCDGSAWLLCAVNLTYTKAAYEYKQRGNGDVDDSWGQHALLHAAWKQGLRSGRAHYWSTVTALFFEKPQKAVVDNEVPLQGCTQLFSP